MPRPYTACVHIPLSVPSIQPSTDRAALRRVLMILRLRMAGQVPGRLRRDEAPQEAVDFPRLVAADGVHSARAAAAPWRPPCGRQPLPKQPGTDPSPSLTCSQDWATSLPMARPLGPLVCVIAQVPEPQPGRWLQCGMDVSPCRHPACWVAHRDLPVENMPVPVLGLSLGVSSTCRRCLDSRNLRRCRIRSPDL